MELIRKIVHDLGPVLLAPSSTIGYTSFLEFPATYLIAATGSSQERRCYDSETGDYSPPPRNTCDPCKVAR